MAKESKNNIVDTMEGWFKKAPVLPTNVKEGVVRYAPILALIFGILGILIGLAAGGILTVLAPLALLFGVHSYGGSIIAGWGLLISSALLLAAYPGVKARKLGGWNLLFWSNVVSIVGSLISGSIGGAILGFFIGFYLLFQIKSHYK